MRLSHITVYQQPIFIDIIDIIYNKYKTIISSNFIQCDLLEFKYNVYTSEDHEDIDTIQTEDNKDNEDNEEIKRLETILKLLKYNYKYILKKCILYIRSNIHICLYHSIIESNKKSHNVNISHITCTYKDKQAEECKKCNGKWIINGINCPDQILLGNQRDSEIKNNTWNLPKDQECQIRNKCKIPDKSDFTSRDMFNCEQNEKNCTDICKGNWNLPNK